MNNTLTAAIRLYEKEADIFSPDTDLSGPVYPREIEDLARTCIALRDSINSFIIKEDNQSLSSNCFG